MSEFTCLICKLTFKKPSQLIKHRNRDIPSCYKAQRFLEDTNTLNLLENLKDLEYIDRLEKRIKTRDNTVGGFRHSISRAKTFAQAINECNNKKYF